MHIIHNFYDLDLLTAFDLTMPFDKYPVAGLETLDDLHLPLLDHPQPYRLLADGVAFGNKDKLFVISADNAVDRHDQSLIDALANGELEQLNFEDQKSKKVDSKGKSPNKTKTKGAKKKFIEDSEVENYSNELDNLA